LLAQVPQITRTRIERSIAVVAQITTGDHSERADGRERSWFRAAQRVLAIAVADDLALVSTRQVQIARGRVTRIAVALRTARAVARVVSVVIRLPGVARTATEVGCSVLAIAAARRLRQPQVVVAIEIIMRTASGVALMAKRKSIVVTRVVVAWIKTHDFSSARILCDLKLG
jgi:hypothetical protein